DEDLDLLGPVAELEEVDLPLPAPEHDPAGDADARTWGLGVVGQWQLPDVGDGLVVVEAMPPGGEAEGLDLVQLLPPRGFQEVEPLVGHLRSLLTLRRGGSTRNHRGSLGLSSMPSTAELFFVEIRTGDRNSLVAWYVEALGLAVTLDDPKGDFTVLAAGPTRLAIQGGR